MMMGKEIKGLTIEIGLMMGQLKMEKSLLSVVLIALLVKVLMRLLGVVAIL